MSPNPANVRVSVQMGEDQNIVIHFVGRSSPVVARCLGVDRDESGKVERIFLDRKIHRPGRVYGGDWAMSGAISTILERQAADPQSNTGDT